MEGILKCETSNILQEKTVNTVRLHFNKTYDMDTVGHEKRPNVDVLFKKGEDTKIRYTQEFRFDT